MEIAVFKETKLGENRVALIPATVKKLIAMGAIISIESNAGAGCGFTDESYQLAGAEIKTKEQLFTSADLSLRLHQPSLEDVAQTKENAISISFLDPFNSKQLVESMAAKSMVALSMEMIPRSTYSQKMDALSSQANLAGYVMALKAAEYLNRIFPMMMTPAGTLKPAKVFIIGAGVAGLQAIATAKRLGAKVTAFDTRSVVAEQVESLGAKFFHIDLGETGQTKDGYALALTPEQLDIQKTAQKQEISESDVLITTAQVFGRKPPMVVTADVVNAMKPGSVIIDMAAETGGNVEGSKPGETITTEQGVIVVGTGNWANDVAQDASQVYSSNLFHLLDEFWHKEQKSFELDMDNDAAGCVITQNGQIVNKMIRKHYGLEE